MTTAASLDGFLSPEQAIAAERAIRRCLLDYCRGVDRCDEALVASSYHPDATDDHGTFIGLGREFARRVTRHLRSHAEATTHFLSDPIIDFTSPTTAEVEVQVLAWHRVTRGESHFLEKFCGRYFDRFECRNGDWRISHRSLTHDWDCTEPIEPAFAPGTFASSPRS